MSIGRPKSSGKAVYVRAVDRSRKGRPVYFTIANMSPAMFKRIVRATFRELSKWVQQQSAGNYQQIAGGTADHAAAPEAPGTALPEPTALAESSQKTAAENGQ